MSKTNKTSVGFFICGLTGGPYFPIPAILKQLSNIEPILVGIANSYESRISHLQNIPIVYLPQAKLNLTSFKNQSVTEIFFGVIDLCKSVILLVFSFCRCILLLIKYKPVLVYGTGSFLQVPIMWATRLTNLFGLTKAKIIVHQQDPLVGLATRLTLCLADLSSCVFEYSNSYTKSNFNFTFNHIIPNPIIIEKYVYSNDYEWADIRLGNFIIDLSDSKPLLLIFGGGSGALFINNWVFNNLSLILQKYRIIHITGVLQGEIQTKFDSNYFQTESVLVDMPKLMASVSLVICRAGLGSISELLLLNKPTFLVPLPVTHQELNAKLVIEQYSNFFLLEQKNMSSWVDSILSFNQNQTFQNSNFKIDSLQNYYDHLDKIIN